MIREVGLGGVGCDQYWWGGWVVISAGGVGGL